MGYQKEYLTGVKLVEDWEIEQIKKKVRFWCKNCGKEHFKEAGYHICECNGKHNVKEIEYDISSCPPFGEITKVILMGEETNETKD